MKTAGVNKILSVAERLRDQRLIKKILHPLPPKFEHHTNSYFRFGLSVEGGTNCEFLLKRSSLAGGLNFHVAV